MPAVALAAALLLTSCGGSAVEVTVPDALVAPGSTVKLDETVRVPGNAYEKRDGSRYLEDAEVGLTVVAVKEQDPSVLDALDNAEEFEGFTPVTVAFQVDIPQGVELDTPSAVGPYGVLASGEFAQYLDMEGWGNGDVLTKMCWESGAVDNARTRQSCSVLLVPEGETLAEILWDGQASSAIGLPGDGPYVEKPLVLPMPKKG